MKKMIAAAAILCSVILFSGCGSSGGDPKAALTAFFDAMGKKDMEAARKLATADSKAMLDMIEMGMKMAKDQKQDDQFDKSRMEFGEAKIDGDKATVPVKDKKSGESTSFSLKKEEGQWKVAFDKSSIMQMASEKIQEKGGMDSIANSLDELKKLDSDSLKAAMQEGMKAMDSAKEVLKQLENK
jgi:delta 1-pyrroline-5-carboxylate dehydrogenase